MLKKLNETSRLTTPTIGNKVFELPAPWKPSGMGFTPYGVVFCACNNTSRRHSRIYLNWNLIHEDDGKKDTNETIGNPLVNNGREVILIGENGRVFHFDGKTLHKKFSTTFASAVCNWKGETFWFDTKDRKISARDMGGTKRFAMPGSGIVLSATEHTDGHLYCAVADAEDGKHGISSSEGWLTRINDCLCVVSYHDLLVYSAGNKLYAKDKGLICSLPCEKIMDIRVADNKVWITGDNPGCLYFGNMRGDFMQVTPQVTPQDTPYVPPQEYASAKVGGSCFRTRVAMPNTGENGYIALAPGGNSTSVFNVIWK